MRDLDPVIRLMYRGTTTMAEFNWENMQPSRSILSLMTQQDIDNIRKIILSPRYSGNSKLKLEKVDEIMHSRGFTKFAGGTNRIVYEHPDAPRMVFKVAVDRVGITDSPAEFYNQNLLKPFCCKVFECSACGTIASFEKVKRVTSIEEFSSIAEDYCNLVMDNILGKYVMEDIGIKYFMNYGVRVGFGPVILDFPYLFELDGNKLICKAELEDHSICNGEIDYDDGFNKLICCKCGRHYMARDLAITPEKKKALLRSKGAMRMRVNLVNANNGEVMKSFDTNDVRDHLSRDNVSSILTKKERKPMKVNIVTVKVPVEETTTTTNPTLNKINTAKTTDKVVEQPTTEKKVEEAKKTKTIVVKLGNAAKKVEKKETPAKHLSVKLVMKKVNVPNNTKNTTSNKPASVDTHKDEAKKVNRNTSNVEAPIVKRTINVSLGKRPSTTSQIITADTVGHRLNVYTTAINQIQKVEEKKEDDQPEQTQPEELTSNAIPEVETKVEETVVEETTTPVEEVKEEVVEETKEEEELDPNVDNFAENISEIPSMEVAKEETTPTEDVVVNDNVNEGNESEDSDKLYVNYLHKIPENLEDYENCIVIIVPEDQDVPEDSVMVDYKDIDFSMENIYITNKTTYIITGFAENDNEIKMMIDLYNPEENGDAAQTDESETINENTADGEAVSSMSDEDIINRILSSSSEKPSLKDMYNK